MDPSRMLKPQLINELNRLGLDSSGTRQILRARLEAHLRAGAAPIALPEEQELPHVQLPPGSPPSQPVIIIVQCGNRMERVISYLLVMLVSIILFILIKSNLL